MCFIFTYTSLNLFLSLPPSTYIHTYIHCTDAFYLSTWTHSHQYTYTSLRTYISLTPFLALFLSPHTLMLTRCMCGVIQFARKVIKRRPISKCKCVCVWLFLYPLYLEIRCCRQISLITLHPRNPPNPQNQIPCYKFKLHQILNLYMYRKVPKNLSISIWWISGMLHFQWILSYCMWIPCIWIHAIMGAA